MSKRLRPTEGEGTLTNWHYVFGTALAVCGLLLVWAYAISLSLPAAGIFHDDGIYVVTARALAEGQGYRITSLPDSPPQTKYPLLFPWILSLIWRIAPVFPDNLLWLRMVPAVSTVLWLWLSWQLLRRCGVPRSGCTAVVALTAVSPWAVFLGTSLLSETLFAALLTGSLLLLTKLHEDSAPVGRVYSRNSPVSVMSPTLDLTTTRRLVSVMLAGASQHKRAAVYMLAGLLAGASFLTRTAGIAVVLAGVAWLLMNRRRAGALLFGVAAASLVIPWAIWVMSNGSAGAESYYSASNYGSWNVVAHYAWHEKFEVVARNAMYSIATPLALWGIEGSIWLAVPAALLAAAACRGMWLTRTHPVTWFVMLYSAMVMMWVWPPTRFFVPLVPLFLWHVYVATRRMPTMPIAVIVMALMLTSSAALVRSANHARIHGAMWSRPEFAEDWYRLSALFEWIRRETPPNAVLAGNLDPTYFLYAGRKGVRAYAADPYVLFYSSGHGAGTPLGSVGEFRRRLLLAGADYCVWSPGPGFGESPHFRRLLDDLSHEVPGSLTIATGDVVAGYVVYRIDRTKLAEAEWRQAS